MTRKKALRYTFEILIICALAALVIMLLAFPRQVGMLLFRREYALVAGVAIGAGISSFIMELLSE